MTPVQAQARIAELEAQLTEARGELEREREAHRQEREHAARLVERMRKLLDLLPAGVILIGGDGRVRQCNPAAADLLGEPLQGEPWIDIIGRSFSPRSDDGHEVSLRDGRRVSLATRAMENEPGQLVLLTNQTDTRLLQSRLAHYQRLSEMGRMVASLAHQIRTPLSAALLYAGHLGRAELTAEQRIRFAGKVKARLTNLEQQVRDMLVFARGETRLDDSVTTEELFRAIEDMLDAPLSQQDADCDCRNDAPGVRLQCNRETLLGALQNLVDNALQACGSGAELQLTARIEDEHLRLEVADQGPGMDADTREQALQPFYTTRSHGTGLGLAVAQVVARAHHGRFELESAQGVGTRAAILLPFLREA
ncbi:PAS domain-containing sensor histidine kinase [Marinobacterium nitratireducens]|uniref:histidine kinase n=1 Tax=Marinobacterium nitratireducens TaxID=518897 RepID=A0A917ZJV0_9GAMM|nr:ATP-binding protein [Marinobacterium nitratireducens]GGO84944.1 PAS domain-containing sensor histidine kinase [Marinobacterium nitratireducens]